MDRYRTGPKNPIGRRQTLNLDPIRRVLYAPNVHVGGGKALLLPLLDLLKQDPDILFVLDRRLEMPKGWPDHAQAIYVEPSVASRLWTEWRLRTLLHPRMKILCMGNLPPLFASTSATTVFVQNRYLTGKADLADFAWPIRLRIALENLWFRLRLSSVSRLIVQGPTTQRELQQRSGRRADILPFVAYESLPDQVDPDRKRLYDFIYVASGEPHKNHRNLVEAWIILAKRGHRPSLCLTLSSRRFPDLLAWIETRTRKHGLRITNAGALSPDRVNALYQSAGALVYPSRFESFGLPLFEALAARLPILAAERSYVHDLIDNPMTFDPEDPFSLALAVDKFPFIASRPAIEVIDAKDFVREAFSN
ncbi:MAG: glycosyltransferase [Gammaproteobacteria bacterium]